MNARGDGGRFVWHALLACTAVLTVVSALVFVVRFVDVLRYGDLFVTSGAEGPGIYAVWKRMNGHPLYEQPTRAFYATSLYNWLFYEVYARALSLVGARDGAIAVWGRSLTGAFAAAGAAIHWMVLRNLACREPGPRPDRAQSAFLAMMALVTWVGPSFAKWWPLAIRPDLPALAFVVLGLLLHLKGEEEGRPAQTAGASVAFYAAWAMKQSYVWIFVALVLRSAFGRRRPREAALLIVPMGALVIATLLLGGRQYRYDVLIAPSLSTFTLKQSVTMVFRSLVPNLFVFGFPVVALLADRRFLRNGPAPWLLAATVPAAVVMAGKEGSNTNYLYEAYLAACTFASVSVIDIVRRSRGEVQTALLSCAALSMASMLVMPALLFVSGAGPARLGPLQTHGALHLATAGEIDAKKRLIELARGLPKPLLVRDEIVAQPWHATEGRFPALVVDFTFYENARRRGAIEDGGMAALVSTGHFASLVVSDADEVYRPALAAGYRIASEISTLGPERLSVLTR